MISNDIAHGLLCGFRVYGKIARKCVHICVHGGDVFVRARRSVLTATHKDTKKDEDARKRYRESTVESPSSAVEISDKNFRINIVFLPFRVEWGLFVCCMMCR